MEKRGKPYEVSHWDVPLPRVPVESEAKTKIIPKPKCILVVRIASGWRGNTYSFYVHSGNLA